MMLKLGMPGQIVVKPGVFIQDDIALPTVFDKPKRHAFLRHSETAT
jgi:hypothetical protein